MAKTMAQRLAAYGDELEAQADTLLEEHAPVERASVPLPMMEKLPTGTHVALVDLMDRILELGQRYSHGEPGDAGDASGGVMLRTTVRTIRKLRPYVLEQLAKVPEDEIRTFMATLVNEISAAIAPATADVDEEAHGPGPDQPERAGAGAAGGRDPGRQVDAG